MHPLNVLIPTPHPRGHLAMSGDIFSCHTGGWGLLFALEARDAANHHTRHRSPKCHSVRDLESTCGKDTGVLVR